jgi:hypothetical protein
MKPKLKPPGTELLKLGCDGPLSNFAFNFNLRRFTVVISTIAYLVAIAFTWCLSAGAYTRPLFSST